MIPNRLITAASFSPEALQSPNAWVGHLPFAAWIIQEISPKIFVELGTHSGNSYFAFCQSVVEGGLSTKCYAVDTWQGDDHAGEYTDEIFAKVDAYHREKYAGFSRLLRMTFDDAATYFADESIDLLHIDGLHTYEAVRHDFETWLPKLAPGAVVIFHDTNVRERNFGVWKLWAELQVRYPNNLEFVHSHGLGVLQLNNAPDNKLLECLQPNSPEKQQLIKFFAEREVQIANLNQAMAEMYNSTCWRITWPIRIVVHQFKRVRRVAELAMPAIRRGGGLKNTLKKAFKLYRLEGLAGIRRGFRIVATSDPVRTSLSYADWICRYDTLTDESRAVIRSRMDAIKYKPLISVLMPTYNTKPEWLIEAIESVRGQIYPNWELCIADDASTNVELLQLLEKFAKQDSRIKVHFDKVNGHISTASNSALRLASGDYVALLDHDDLLSEDALYHVAKLINEKPDIALIYSDEDKVDVDGRRFDPYFKTDWNPDLFYSHNMFCHLGVFKRSLVNDVGGFRVGLEGSQDYDLTLRCIERIDVKQIAHLPLILYHWRVHVKSTSMSSDSKPYAMIAGARAINEHFQRTGVNGRVELFDYGYKPFYDLPTPPPFVSIIIPTRNSHTLVKQCIDSIHNISTYPSYEIILIDNGSDDFESIQQWRLLEKQGVRVLRDDGPFNYSALNNRAAAIAVGEVLVLINNDTEVIEPKWLEIMVGHAVRPGIGPVGAKLLYPDNTIQHAGVVLGLGGQAGAAGHAHYKFPATSTGYLGRISLTSNFSAVTGACLAVRRDLYLKVGGLDEENLRIAFNDVDFCLKLGELGYRCVYTPDAVLYHHESASRGAEDNPEKKARFKQESDWMRARWGRLIDNDPFYNPNLTLEFADFSLAWPPRVCSE
jgi:GT2 family glycosyltransferase